MVSCGDAPLERESLREIISRYGVAHLHAVDHDDAETERGDEEFPAVSLNKDLSINEMQGSEPITTLMLKNIPCKLTKELMEEELNELGFAGTYDVIHLPARNNGSNKGYGFINFTTVEDARCAAETLNGYAFTRTRSYKLCSVTRAAVQGREALLKCRKQDRQDHSERPSMEDDKELSTQVMQDPKPITTLMISGISFKLTKETMENELRELGFAGTYDVIHIPARNNKFNKGYAFINFTSADNARCATEALNGYTFIGTHSTKRCQVTSAGFQGREASLKRAECDEGFSAAQP
eukprot:TRINITY_DN983_c0_g2_i1.p1 TRINITY_DN983_c0_g2~~TRINITY_DN983_c0_g2_i1.p1  ORF type:complete len:295 (-),score=60.55 TRINITY_DN983_c0_g2_i1:220-1104(-)